MSLRSIVEFAVTIDSFRNIDLFHQGLYKLQICIYKDSCYSYPYNMSSRYANTSPEDPHNISPTTLEETYVETKSFLVRYFDEAVQLNETYHFRSEIELDSGLSHSHFTLKFSLLFTDLNGIVTPEQIAQSSAQAFESVSIAEFKLRFPSTFQSLYIPVLFDDNHCCLVTSLVHFLAIDYKFRPLFQPRHSSTSEGLASIIFNQSHKTGREYIGSSLTDSTYAKFMTPLSKTYTRLREYYISVLQNCLSEAQRHMLQLYYIPPALSLPGSPVQLLNPALALETISTAAINESDDEYSTEEKTGKLCRFSQRVASHDAKKIATFMMAELSSVSGQIFQLWHRFHEITPNCTAILISMLRDKYNVSNRQEISAGHIRKVLRSADLGLRCDARKPEHHKLVAETKRRQNGIGGKKEKILVECMFVIDSQSQPILIEEFCILDRCLPAGPLEIYGGSSNNFARDVRRRESCSHLIVLVHGFQGSSSDMRIIKNMLSLCFPNNLYLCSAYNENDSESSITLLGQRLAEEINDFIKENCIINLGRLSFIGHSLGGLIIRAALSSLENFSDKMHLFLTLSSPHLGIIEGSSKLIRAGLWVLNNFKKCESLKQLSFADSLSLKECFLYKLSQAGGCQWFTHMVLISSPQDLYSPHYSARVETHKELKKYGNNGKELKVMAKAILAGRERIHRIDVDFVLPSNNFDNWIGRAGHIEFLENHAFMKTLAFLHPEFFE